MARLIVIFLNYNDGQLPEKECNFTKSYANVTALQNVRNKTIV